MYNFKYHTIEDLERLVENLKNNIAVLKIYGRDPGGLKQQFSVEEESMLRDAETEILERTLLGAVNEGGCSE